MNQVINVKMSKREHSTLALKTAVFLGFALLLKVAPVTSFESVNNAIIALFSCVTVVYAVKWVTAEIEEKHIA